MDRRLSVRDWQEVQRRLAKAKTLRQRAEMIVSLFGFPRDQVAHTEEWNRKVPLDMRDDRHRIGHRPAAPVSAAPAPSSVRRGETPEEYGARISREHPEWPRCEIMYTPEWYAKVRGEAVHGFGDVWLP